MMLFWLVVENIGRLLMEWAARHREVYVTPRPLVDVLKETWNA